MVYRYLLIFLLFILTLLSCTTSEEFQCNCSKNKDKEKLNNLLTELNKRLDNNIEKYYFKISKWNYMEIVCNDKWIYRFKPKYINNQRLLILPCKKEDCLVIDITTYNNSDDIEIIFSDGRIMEDHITLTIYPEKDGKEIANILCKIFCLYN